MTVLQDNNLVDRTPDFRLEEHGTIVGFGEAVTTTVGARADQLRAFSEGRLQFDTEELKSTWWVTVMPKARRKNLERTLIGAFSSLEAREAHLQLNGLPSLDVPPPEIATLEGLGLIEIVCDPRPRVGPGRIYGLPGGISGPIRIDWAECATWIDSFLASELCLRKLAKLVEAGEAAQRHLYVGVTADDPWSVHQALRADNAELQLRPPALPEGLTHLWLHGAEFPGTVLSWWPDRGWFDVRGCWATA